MAPFSIHTTVSARLAPFWIHKSLRSLDKTKITHPHSSYTTSVALNR